MAIPLVSETIHGPNILMKEHTCRQFNPKPVGASLGLDVPSAQSSLTSI